MCKEYISIGMTSFGEVQSIAVRAYAQSGQYHTIVGICDFKYGIRAMPLTKCRTKGVLCLEKESSLD